MPNHQSLLMASLGCLASILIEAESVIVARNQTSTDGIFNKDN